MYSFALYGTDAYSVQGEHNTNHLLAEKRGFRSKYSPADHREKADFEVTIDRYSTVTDLARFRG